MRKIGFALAALVFVSLFILDSGALLRIAGMALGGRFGARAQIGGFAALAASVFLAALAFAPRDRTAGAALPRKIAGKARPLAKPAAGVPLDASGDAVSNKAGTQGPKRRRAKSGEPAGPTTIRASKPKKPPQR